MRISIVAAILLIGSISYAQDQGISAIGVAAEYQFIAVDDDDSYRSSAIGAEFRVVAPLSDKLGLSAKTLVTTSIGSGDEDGYKAGAGIGGKISLGLGITAFEKNGRWLIVTAGPSVSMNTFENSYWSAVFYGFGASAGMMTIIDNGGPFRTYVCFEVDHAFGGVYVYDSIFGEGDESFDGSTSFTLSVGLGIKPEKR